jgi:phospholipid/cholesterol/gamma-HCH transport system ATP-binding protein
MDSAPAPKIAVSGLEKSFGQKRVLDGLDIACGVGESLVIIGGSGTGKSVLIKCILGILRPDAGSIRIDGAETVTLGRADRTQLMLKFGMLFQGSALFDSLSVWENVAFGLIQGRGMERQQARAPGAPSLFAPSPPRRVRGWRRRRSSWRSSGRSSSTTAPPMPWPT